MSYLGPDKSHQPPIGMTSITGQKLEGLKAVYHDLIGKIVHSGTSETLLLSHFGDFNQVKNESTLKVTESMILEAGDKRQTMKRFCSLMIEVLQNISLHGARDRSGHMHAYLVVARSKQAYRLMTGNLVLSGDIPILEKRMHELNSLDKNALRKLYIETLCNEEFSYKGGAGLGLLTIAKRADEKLKYEVQKVDENFGYFQLEVAMTND